MESFSPLAFMELLVVLAFAVGWFVLERVARRFDKRDKEDAPPTPRNNTDEER